MLSAVIISPDAELAEQMQNVLSQAGRVRVVRNIQQYPSEPDLARLIRAHAPQIFVLDVSSLDEALRVAAAIEAHAPGTQILAIDRACDQGTLLELMRAGIREFISVPLGLPELAHALLRMNAALERKPPGVESTDLLFTFLPAKAGVGCSTIALNTSVALAAMPDTKVLLADFDLNCGVIGFLLHLDHSRSIVDAAERAPQMDEEIWPRLVCAVGDLDVLPAGPLKPGFRIEAAHIRYLLDFARRNYKVICADLSGLMEKYSVELMQESKRICLVCTPELPSLHLARQKVEYLRSLQLEDRVSLLLNRAQKRSPITTNEIEKMIGIPVSMEFPNDYRGVHKAVSDAKPVSPGSELGKCFSELARKILANGPVAAPSRRFIDYFSISPARFSFTPERKPTART